MVEVFRHSDGHSVKNKVDWGKIKAVIFDNDGLLIDSEVIYTKCYHEILAKYNCEFSMDLKAKIVGRRMEEVSRICIEEHGLRGTVGVDDFSEYSFSVQLAHLHESRLMEGAEGVVEMVLASGKACAIATSSFRKVFETTTRDHRELYDKIKIVVSGDDPQVHHGKPAPDIYLIAATRLQVRPQDCLVFEDSPHGVKAALAAGMKVVWIPDPNHIEQHRREQYGEYVNNPNVVILKSLSDFH